MQAQVYSVLQIVTAKPALDLFLASLAKPRSITRKDWRQVTVFWLPSHLLPQGPLVFYSIGQPFVSGEGLA